MASRVLLIDDDDRLGDMLGTYLRSRGFEVEHRADGGSGLRALANGRFDAVVLDVMLPDLDGFEVLKKLRQTTDVAVLMLTARGEDTDRIVGLELGADDYLPKPLTRASWWRGSRPSCGAGGRVPCRAINRCWRSGASPSIAARARPASTASRARSPRTSSSSCACS